MSACPLYSRKNQSSEQGALLCLKLCHALGRECQMYHSPISTRFIEFLHARLWHGPMPLFANSHEDLRKTGGVHHEIRPIRMRHLWSGISPSERAVLRGICGEIFALFQAWVSNFDTIPPWKVVGTLYLDSSCFTFKYFAFLNVWEKFELIGHVQAAVRIWVLFSSFFLDSLLVTAVLSDYSGQLVTSTFLLYKFRGLPGSTPVIFPVMRPWKCLGMKRLYQPSSTTSWKRTEKLAEAKADGKQVTQNLGRVSFILNQKR